jgi:hypothetical protein
VNGICEFRRDSEIGNGPWGDERARAVIIGTEHVSRLHSFGYDTGIRRLGAPFRRRSGFWRRT